MVASLRVRRSGRCTSREQNAHLDEHRIDPPPTISDGPAHTAPHRSRSADHDSQRERLIAPLSSRGGAGRGRALGQHIRVDGLVPRGAGRGIKTTRQPPFSPPDLPPPTRPSPRESQAATLRPVRRRMKGVSNNLIHKIKL